jgi:hypothetical protein
MYSSLLFSALLNDGKAVLFPTFEREMAQMDKPPFIAVCFSKNKH